MEKSTFEIQLYYSEDYAVAYNIFRNVWGAAYCSLFFFFRKDFIGYALELNLFLQIAIGIVFFIFLSLPLILYHFFCKFNKVLVKVSVHEKYLDIQFSQKSWIYPQNKSLKIYWETCETYKFAISAQKGDLMLSTAVAPSKFYLSIPSVQDLDVFRAFQDKIQGQWKDYNLKANKQNKVWQHDESKTFLGKLQSAWSLVLLIFVVGLSYYLYSKRETSDNWELAKYILISVGFFVLAIFQVYHSFFKPRKY
jgi:hypothetical protein